jgi:hypothetical protein
MYTGKDKMSHQFTDSDDPSDDMNEAAIGALMSHPNYCCAVATATNTQTLAAAMPRHSAWTRFLP